MGGYVVNFTVYTMAMIGLICFAVFVYRKITDGSFSSKSGKYLSVEETMSLSPRKTLHVVRAGKEKFLIASDVDRTTLLAKLSGENVVAATESNDILTDNKLKEKLQLSEKPDVVSTLPDVEDKEEIPAEEHKDEVMDSKEDKIIAFDSIFPAEKEKTVRRTGVRVQRKRTMPKPKVESDYRKPNLSPMKQMAKRINEL